MVVVKDAEQDFGPQKILTSSDEDEKRKKLEEIMMFYKKMVLGGLIKAMKQPGGGDVMPFDGDQDIYHSTVRALDRVVVESTRSEFGGKGILIRQVLSKSKMILGLLEGLPTMLKCEVAMLKMKSELHYGEDDYPVSLSDTFPKDVELNFEIELIDFS